MVFVCQGCHLPKKSTQLGIKWVWTAKYQTFQSKIGLLSPKMPTVWSDPRKKHKIFAWKNFYEKIFSADQLFCVKQKISPPLAKNFANLACLKWRRSNFVMEFSFRDLIVLTKREFWIKNKLFRSNHQLLLGYIHKPITSMA